MIMDERLIVEILFHCMVCDGEIAPSEQEILKKICLMETSLQPLDIELYIQELSASLAVREANLGVFLKKLSKEQLSEEQQIFLLESLIQMILADGILRHEEVAYFNNVCKALSIPRELIHEHFPEREEWLDMEELSLKHIGSDILYTDKMNLQ